MKSYAIYLLACLLISSFTGCSSEAFDFDGDGVDEDVAIDFALVRN